ncbi:Nucleic-acid-binding protein transposon like protein [Argiope bruennichi]|uniref:Nucleic-acid-binding protein transposon like protein n=1 Tax=Argiope bruennichi TaxID=94029 RepID=A0A8T0ECG4_ARGBR|nr:Nucleic-acid-binding protein transposon like protein [Argiope bruennichi]
MEGPPPKIKELATTFEEVEILLNSDILTPIDCNYILHVIPFIDESDNDTPQMSEKARELMKRAAEAKTFLEQYDDSAKPKGENFHIYCETMDDQKKLIKYLNEQNLEYFVISVQTEKPIKVVIEGLPIDTTCEEIEEELKNKGYSISKVNQFRRFKTKALLPIDQVHLLKSANIAKIYEEKTMLYMRVKVEKFIRRTIGQCYKCQSFAHTGSNCKMQTKCVLCAENHDSRTCPEKIKEKPQIKCANCGGPHTASFRGCPKFPKIKKSNPIEEGKSFASLFKKPIARTDPPQEENHTIPVQTINQPQEATNSNNQDFADIFKLVKHLKIIMQAIPNIKDLLKKLETTIEKKTTRKTNYSSLQKQWIIPSSAQTYKPHL